MNTLNNYTGKWIDQTGKVLVITRDGEQFFVDFYKNHLLDTALRKMVTGEFIPTLKMKSHFEGKVLIVELGTEGLGATMRLDHNLIDGEECLVPEIEHGLYGDFEQDFGVPWVFPLSVYARS